ncbi:MAG: O-antigen ligase family protein [Muribaculaceae bacterium]|nr:O-antigen ligase family protein [Muribaculaceae bacterium]MDE6575115.1 O-antigen ligase family protein [Muribaculaceae bacterium]
MINHKVTPFNSWTGRLIGYIVLILFCQELVPYTGSFVDQTIVRIAVYIIGLCLMVVTLFRKKNISHKQSIIWIFIFVYQLMLFARLYVDFIEPGKGFFLYKSPSTIVFFYFFGLLLPAIYFRNIVAYFSIKRIFWYSAVILFICMSASVLKILAGEVDMSRDGRFDSGFGVFSISFGQYACSLALISVYLLKETNLLQKAILIGWIVLSGVCIGFSGSRGPFVAFFVCLAIYLLAQNPRYIWVGALLIVLCLFSDLIKDLFFWLSDYLDSIGVTPFKRIVNTIFAEDGLQNHTSGRDTLVDEGWELFLRNPIFGSSYLIPGKIYVHNIIVEQFMALGIFGGIIFLIINAITFRMGWIVMRRQPSFAIIPILYLQYFIFGCLSITIISLAPLWLFMYLTINRYCALGNFCYNTDV